MPASLPRPVAARGSVAGGNGRNRAAARGETRITGKRFATYSRTARALVSRTYSRLAARIDAVHTRSPPAIARLRACTRSSD